MVIKKFQPSTFGKYVLLHRIATGGMAEVFRAKSFGAKGFEKDVAIKRILPCLTSDSQFVDMFIDEAKLAASLNHANIVQIYDFGSIDYRYFLAMEYVHGKNLGDIIHTLRDQVLSVPIDFACYVMSEALEGLDYAHRKTDAYDNPLSLIHRDISPNNLIISFEGELKILDFGIAKAKSSGVQTSVGTLKGKSAYMSPEQAYGMNLDLRSDIFSLGVCFYELLTLKKMFHGQSELSLVDAVRETNFIHPKKLRSTLPLALVKLVLKALEKNPDDRYLSAAEFREAIQHFMHNANLHYSSRTLSNFMKEIFSEDIISLKAQIAKDADVVERLRCEAQRAARMDIIRETIQQKQIPSLPVTDLNDHNLTVVDSVSTDFMETVQTTSPLHYTPSSKRRILSDSKKHLSLWAKVVIVVFIVALVGISWGLIRKEHSSSEHKPITKFDIDEVKSPDKTQIATGRKSDQKHIVDKRQIKNSSSYVTQNYGSVDVDILGRWAMVYIDGEKIRPAPVINYSLPSGWHIVELKTSNNEVIRQWKIRLKSQEWVKLVHQ